MSTIVIKYDGVDITNDVELDSARFVAMTDGNVGEAFINVLDRRDGTYTANSFNVGKEVTLDIDGKRMWGGWVMRIDRDYPFPAGTPKSIDDEDHYWRLSCVDYNYLFVKRVLWNKANPTKQMKIYRPTSSQDSDKDIIADMVDLYLDLSGDGFQAGGSHAISLADVIELGSLYWVAGCTTTWQAASPGMTWGDGMRSVCAWSGGVFYIGYENSAGTHLGPTLYYHDVNTANGPYPLNDRPASEVGSAGVQNLTFREDSTQMANDALVWGAGMGSTEMAFYRAQDSPRIATHGRFQWSDFSSTMWLQECLEARAKTYINGSRLSHRGHKKPLETWTCTIFSPDFKAGDVVDITSYVFGVSDTVPIRIMTITFPAPDAARFDLVLSHTMDLAFATSLWWKDKNKTDRRGGDRTGRRGGDDWNNDNPLPWWIIPGIPDAPYDPDIHTAPGPEMWIFGAILTQKNCKYNNGTTRQWSRDYIAHVDPAAWGSIDPANRSWPTCPSVGAYCGVSIGCWGPGESYRQIWWAFPALTEPTNKALNLLAHQYKRYGTGGAFFVSVTSDNPALGLGSTFANHPDAQTVPGTFIGVLDITGQNCEDPPAEWNEYNDRWIGGIRWLYSMSMPGHILSSAPDTWNYVVFTPAWAVEPLKAWCNEDEPLISGYWSQLRGWSKSGQVDLDPPCDTQWIWQGDGTVAVPTTREVDDGTTYYVSPIQDESYFGPAGEFSLSPFD